MIKIPSSSSPIMSTRAPSLWKILSETWRIIASHPRHFLTLSALFLLPVSITSSVYLFLKPQPTSLHTLFSMSPPDAENPPAPGPILTPILLSLSTVLVSFCANSCISYSTFSAFNDEPVKLTRSLRTIIASFFPLIATYLATQVIVGVIMFAVGFLMMVAYGMLALSGFESRHFLVFGIITTTVILVMSLLYLFMEWCLSYVVVVLESSWGFAPLRRSSYLVKANRKVAYSLFLMFVVAAGIFQVSCLNLAAKAGEVGKVWIFARIFGYAVLSTAMGLYGLAARTVLYIYCKAQCGETARPTDKKEYVLLPIKE